MSVLLCHVFFPLLQREREREGERERERGREGEGERDGRRYCIIIIIISKYVSLPSCHFLFHSIVLSRVP